MLRFFFTLFVSIFFFISHISGGFADECKNVGDIRDTSFQLNLGCLDPLNEGQNIVGQKGISVLTTLLGQFAQMLLFIIPVIAVISLLVAGYFYIFSAGDSEKTTKAKTIIKWNFVAILVAFLSYGLVQIIGKLFTFTL